MTPEVLAEGNVEILGWLNTGKRSRDHQSNYPNGLALDADDMTAVPTVW
jgi:hypothetical protein